MIPPAPCLVSDTGPMAQLSGKEVAAHTPGGSRTHRYDLSSRQAHGQPPDQGYKGPAFLCAWDYEPSRAMAARPRWRISVRGREMEVTLCACFPEPRCSRPYSYSVAIISRISSLRPTG